MRLLLLTLVLLIVFPCRAQEADAPSKQEIVEVAQKADERVTNFERANQSAKPYISQVDFEKGMEYSASAHKAVAALSKNTASPYASASAAELLIALNQLAITAASEARAISFNGMVTATRGETVSLNALAAADSLTKAQSALTEISELVGHTTLRLITTEERLWSCG
jgi:hypothetical protein